MSLHFGDEHTPEAIDRYIRENKEKIEELIASGALDAPIVDENKSLPDAAIEANTGGFADEDTAALPETQLVG
jgi:hypothetical protein